MKAAELFKSDGTSAGICYCGGCRTIRRSEADATLCCTCNQCGAMAVKGVVGRLGAHCETCGRAMLDAVRAASRERERARAASAPSAPDDYDGPVFEVDGDRFWSSIGEAIDDIASECDQCELPADECPHIPNLFWDAVERRLTIDIDGVLENIDSDQGDEGADPSEATPELRAAVDLWNATSARVVYEPGSRVVEYRPREVAP